MAKKQKKTFTVIPIPAGFTHPSDWFHITVDNEREASFLTEALGIPRSQIWTFDQWMRIAKAYWQDVDDKRAHAEEAKK